MEVGLNLLDAFSSFSADYENTGGTNTDNGQNGFNLVQCSTENGNLSTTSSTITPFSANNVVGYASYLINEPVCAALLPVGKMLDTSVLTNNGSSAFSVLGAQYNVVNGQGTVSLTGGFPRGVVGVYLNEAWADNGAGDDGNGFIYWSTATGNSGDGIGNSSGWLLNVTTGTAMGVSTNAWSVIDMPTSAFAGGTGCEPPWV